MLLASFEQAGSEAGGEVATPSRQLEPLEPLVEKPKKLTAEEKDLRFWLREQAMDAHFEAFRQKGLRSVEQVRRAVGLLAGRPLVGCLSLVYPTVPLVSAD
jgi:hypothetical protein